MIDVSASVRICTLCPTEFDDPRTARGSVGASSLALAEVGADLFKKLGMTVEYRVSDWGTLVQRRASREPPEKGGWSFFHTTWNGLDGLNPGIMQFLRANGERAWFGWPENADIETMRNEWAAAPNLEARNA